VFTVSFQSLSHPAAQEHTIARGWALLHAAGLTWNRDLEAARPLLEESVAIAQESGQQLLLSDSLRELGGLDWRQGDLETARALTESSLAVARGAGHKALIASALGGLGLIAYIQSDREAARPLLDEALSLLQELGDKATLWVPHVRIKLALDEGDDATAHSLAEKSLADSREVNDPSATAYFLQALGIVAANQGGYPSARALLAVGLALVSELEEKRWIPEGLESLAGLAAAEGQTARAPESEELYNESDAHPVVSDRAQRFRKPGRGAVGRHCLSPRGNCL
jgi:tetratricopeptide (TPR) repeat protein